MWRVVGALAALFLLSGGMGTAQADFINGNFATGDLTGWTVFTTANGTNGVDPVTGASLPDVVSFNTTGTGATNSAHFNVGHLSGLVFTDPEGGGISQDLTLGAGTYKVTGAFASLDDPSGLVNSLAGTFSLLVDGAVVQSIDLGGFASSGQVLRGDWDASIALGMGRTNSASKSPGRPLQLVAIHRRSI